MELRKLTNSDCDSLQPEIVLDTFTEDHVFVTKKKSTYHPRLVKAVCKTFGQCMLATTFFKFCNDILMFVSPQILK